VTVTAAPPRCATTATRAAATATRDHATAAATRDRHTRRVTAATPRRVTAAMRDRRRAARPPRRATAALPDRRNALPRRVTAAATRDRALRNRATCDRHASASAIAGTAATRERRAARRLHPPDARPPRFRPRDIAILSKMLSLTRSYVERANPENWWNLTTWMVTKRRLIAAGILAAVIVLGIISRAVPLGWSVYDKSLGDVLYAMAACFALVFLLPRVSKGVIAALGTAACLAVEFLQLTEINTHLLNVPVLRWFLGTTFSWHDVVCYLLGIAVAVVGDGIIHGQTSKGKADDSPPQP
jgi:Protein of unknown function (DUF2809)